VLSQNRIYFTELSEEELEHLADRALELVKVLFEKEQVNIARLGLGGSFGRGDLQNDRHPLDIDVLVYVAQPLGQDGYTRVTNLMKARNLTLGIQRAADRIISRVGGPPVHILLGGERDDYDLDGVGSLEG
jgi:predicted nucleotidyltransferase